MNTSLSSKQSKVYKIAIELGQYSSSQQNLHTLKKTPHINNNHSANTNNTTYRLPKIIDVDQQQNSSRKKSPFKNIFNNIENDHQIMKVDDLINQNIKGYDIVGRKQVKAYMTKLVKKRNAYQRRNQSALSLSRYSSSVKSQNNDNNLYLNKQDVLSFIKSSVNHNNQERSQNLTMTRDQQMLTFGSCKQSNQDLYSLRKSKDAYENYAKTWDKEKSKKLKFPSILDHITNYRSKVEYLQSNSLTEQKLHMKNKVWQQTLRTQKNVQNYYDDKYVEKIIKHSDSRNTMNLPTSQKQPQKLMSFSLKGKDKLKKQMQWIDEKDKHGYAFVFVDGFGMNKGDTTIINSGNANKIDRDSKTSTGKQQLCGQSRLSKFNNNKGRQVNSLQKNNQGSRVRFIIRNQSMCDIKSILIKNNNPNTLQQQKRLMKQPYHQSTVLSQFSNLTSSSPQGNNKQPQKKMVKLRL